MAGKCKEMSKIKQVLRLLTTATKSLQKTQRLLMRYSTKWSKHRIATSLKVKVWENKYILPHQAVPLT